MGWKPRQRVLLAARIVAVLAAIAFLLVFAARTKTSTQDAKSGRAAPSPSAPQAARTVASAAATSRVRVPGQRSVCQAVPSLARFSAQVLGSPHQGGAINVSDADIVAKADEAKSVARQLCALPVFPAKKEFCLASIGSWFQLIFDAKDGEYWTVWVSSGGCEQVIGAGDKTRTAVPAAPRLWPRLLGDLRDAQPLSP